MLGDRVRRCFLRHDRSKSRRRPASPDERDGIVPRQTTKNCQSYEHEVYSCMGLGGVSAASNSPAINPPPDTALNSLAFVWNIRSASPIESSPHRCRPVWSSEPDELRWLPGSPPVDLANPITRAFRRSITNSCTVLLARLIKRGNFEGSCLDVCC